MPLPPDAVVVSDVSHGHATARPILDSNIDFVNALFTGYVNADEVSADALRSYYVDYYLAEVRNGGFSQFV